MLIKQDPFNSCLRNNHGNFEFIIHSLPWQPWEISLSVNTKLPHFHKLILTSIHTHTSISRSYSKSCLYMTSLYTTALIDIVRDKAMYRRKIHKICINFTMASLSDILALKWFRIKESGLKWKANFMTCLFAWSSTSRFFFEDLI